MPHPCVVRTVMVGDGDEDEDFVVHRRRPDSRDGSGCSWDQRRSRNRGEREDLRIASSRRSDS